MSIRFNTSSRCLSSGEVDMVDRREHGYWGDDVPLLIARAQAINAFAELEQSLFLTFTALMGISGEYAGIVFFRITNAHSRNTIIESLLKKRLNGEYSKYYNPLLKFIDKELDKKRNSIVHWHTMANIGTAGDPAEYVLVPPNFWALSDESPSVTVEDMESFKAKCHFTARSLNMFYLHFSGHLAQMSDEDEQATWRKIFLQPFAYPPPDSHPLSQNYKAP